MRRLGLIGGMSWESTLIYYRALNAGIRDRLGGLHSAPLLLDSLDFAEIAALQSAGSWGVAGDRLAESARRLEGAGAEAVMLCTNTMHKVAPAIEAALGVPLIHIADPLGQALAGAGHRRPLLLGTRFTMEEPFLVERLARVGLTSLVPDPGARHEIDRVIFEELCRGVVAPASRDFFRRIVAEGAAAGADAVIAGCTEIGLLIGPDDIALPLFDTSLLHAAAGVDFIVSDANTI